MSVVPKVTMADIGPDFSRLVQGYWRLAEWGMTPQQCLTFIKQHLELGITTVDHAHIYGNPSCESLFGAALALEPSLRNQLEVISKCGIEPGRGALVPHYDARKQTIIASVELSLSRLGVECLDTLLIHRPDYLLHADEVAEAFVALKAAGKVTHFGVSNFTASQFDLLQSRLDAPLVTNQIELNPVNLAVFESGILEQLQQYRVAPMAWSPLCGGRVFSEQSPQMIRLRSVLQDVASEIGAGTIDLVIYAWVLKLPANPVLILGTGDIERVKRALGALDISLTHEQWYRILVASQGCNVP